MLVGHGSIFIIEALVVSPIVVSMFFSLPFVPYVAFVRVETTAKGLVGCCALLSSKSGRHGRHLFLAVRTADSSDTPC